MCVFVRVSVCVHVCVNGHELALQWYVEGKTVSIVIREAGCLIINFLFCLLKYESVKVHVLGANYGLITV